MRFGLTLVLMFFSLFQESATVPKPKDSPQWYDKVVGIIGIPAAAIGCAYAYLLIKKTRLESQKLELELEEKRQQLSQGKPADAIVGNATSVAHATAEEALKNQIYLLLLIRYVLWELVAACYSWLITPIQWIASTAFTVLAFIASQRFDTMNLNNYLDQHKWVAFPAVTIVQGFPHLVLKPDTS
jgi:hypothetical protein